MKYAQHKNKKKKKKTGVQLDGRNDGRTDAAITITPTERRWGLMNRLYPGVRDHVFISLLYHNIVSKTTSNPIKPTKT